MKNLEFYKTCKNEWFVDLPDYTGDVEDLIMVSGADTLLEQLSQGENEISLDVDLTSFDACFTLNIVENHGDCATYLIGDLRVWLCPVILFVFGHIPNTIYFKVSEQ